MTDMYQFNHLTKRVDKSRERMNSKTTGTKYQIDRIRTNTGRKKNWKMGEDFIMREKSGNFQI